MKIAYTTLLIYVYVLYIIHIYIYIFTYISQRCNLTFNDRQQMSNYVRAEGRGMKYGETSRGHKEMLWVNMCINLILVMILRLYSYIRAYKYVL